MWKEHLWEEWETMMGKESLGKLNHKKTNYVEKDGWREQLSRDRVKKEVRNGSCFARISKKMMWQVCVCRKDGSWKGRRCISKRINWPFMLFSCWPFLYEIQQTVQLSETWTSPRSKLVRIRRWLQRFIPTKWRLGLTHGKKTNSIIYRGGRW